MPNIRYVLFFATFALCLAAIGYSFYKTPISDNVGIIATDSVTVDAYISPTLNPHLRTVLAEYDAFLQESLSNHLAPGFAVVIVQDSSILYLKGFGLRDASRSEFVNAHTVFRLASVSKCFASLLTGVLVDEGHLKWDDPVIKYLPDFKLKSEEYTHALSIRNVLSHTIGLPYHAFTDRVDQGVNYDSLVYHLRDLDLVAKPGTLYSYQNVGYSLIGNVIASATGKTYDSNLKEKIFGPLRMLNASSSFEQINKNKNVAKPHKFINGWMPLPISSTYYNVTPAGGVNASITDMAFWLRSLTSRPPGLLKEETEDEIFHPIVRATTRNYNFRLWKPVKSAFYALGWRVIQFSDDTLNYHGGFVNGYRSEVAIDRKDRIGICVLVNAPASLADISIPRFFELYTKKREAIQNWTNHKDRVVAER